MLIGTLTLMNTKFWLNSTRKINKWKSELWHFVYPKFCLICSQEIVQDELSVCPICEGELHYTYFEQLQEPSDLDKVFWGRIQLIGTYALLNYSTTNSTQKILHALKYGNNPKIGHYFGALMGDKLKALHEFSDVDAIIPVPLHPKKEFQRGYNQAKAIADGVTRTFPIAIRPELLKRNAYTDTQTKRNRLSRWENMQNRFEAKQSNFQAPKHILIIDDVITTGATLESIVLELSKKFPESKFSVASLARAI